MLLLEDREIAGPGPERGVVFQNHSLLPWLTCFENVYLAVERVFGAKEGKAKLKERTAAAISLVGLDHASAKYPHEISGGMKQRVGIARALSMEPKVLLMDEPFGALDALTRAKLQDELMRICEATKATTVMVTHDVNEAVLLSDRIVMMTNGPAATIGEILEVKLPRPRQRLILAHDPAYIDYPRRGARIPLRKAGARRKDGCLNRFSPPSQSFLSTARDVCPPAFRPVGFFVGKRRGRQCAALTFIV